ncbi:MAG: radical SAM protein [Nocardiopsaceae bacterium]|nr:radical SAM protein [Nocardiopsaceae bacterium]
MRRHHVDQAAGPRWRPALFAGPADAAGRVRCLLCPFRCLLADGQSGVCEVRRNRAGTLETATFTAAVTHLTAVERKPLYHVRPGVSVLTVAGPGCSFRCDYCINYRLSQYGRDDAAPWTGDPAEPTGIAARAADAGALLGMSYSEPSLAPELTLELAAHGVPLIWKTNGYLTAAAADLVAPVLLAVNVDVKAADEAAHRHLTGASLAPVWQTIERFRAAGLWVEVSTPLIPGTSAEPEALRAIASRLAAIDPGIPWHLLRFTPDYRLRAAAPTAPADLRAARDVGHASGLRYVYVERALGPAGRNTGCPSCGLTLVERGIWTMVRNAITDGRCPRCGLEIPGRW